MTDLLQNQVVLVGILFRAGPGVIKLSDPDSCIVHWLNSAYRDIYVQNVYLRSCDVWWNWSLKYGSMLLDVNVYDIFLI